MKQNEVDRLLSSGKDKMYTPQEAVASGFATDILDDIADVINTK